MATIAPSTDPEMGTKMGTVVAQPSSQFPVQETPTSALIPPKNPEGGWKYKLCDRCCAGTGDCVTAWCQCGCFPLGQMADKLSSVTGGQKDPVLNYKVIAAVGVALWIIDAVLNTVVELDTNFQGLWVIIIVFLLRGKIRQLRQIEGTCCEDCLTAFFCTPCSITQMVGEMWHDPKQKPGCNWQEKVGAEP
jgi:Cys-rich protein (TIGR01571 family)